MKARVLIADDDPNVITALKLLVQSTGAEVVTAESVAGILEKVEQASFDSVVMDLNFTLDTTSGKEGIECIRRIRETGHTMPIIVMTGWGTVEIAVNALKSGANDFIQKPWNNDLLLTTLENQIRIFRTETKEKHLREENQLLRREHYHTDSDLVAESTSMKQLIASINQLAKSDMNILFIGENGTGKSLLANYLHQCSNRVDQPFISVNMGAISESLYESEMFGHVKGAFTDAREERIGRFELANKGTLFLDEIANIPLPQQAKLLRILEEQKYEKVGSSKTQSVDVRIVSATNSDLEALVRTGEFRRDLLYRLNTVVLDIPPLRDRVADIPYLAEHFLNIFSKKYQLSGITFCPTAITAMVEYSWPGNVRELSHIVERALFSRESNVILRQDLGLAVKVGTNTGTADFENEPTLEELERDIIKSRLDRYNGSVSEAADSLGMSRSSLYRRLHKHKL